MATTPKTAFVLVPGSFARPIFWHKVTDELRSQNYKVDAMSLVSAGDRSPQPPGSMYDDAEAIRASIVRFLDDGLNVVLSMSSYGGVPGSEAVKGLSRSERGEGKTAVVALVYVASVLVSEGQSSNDVMTEGAAAEAILGADDSDPYMHLDDKLHPPLIFSDLPESDQMKYFKTMPPHSRGSFNDKLTYGGYKHTPSIYILTEADMIIPAEKQHRMIDIINADLDEGKQIRKLLFEGAGHGPMLSRPEAVVDVLLEAAGRAA